MNISETEIEKALRAAPKSPPPGGLKESLVANVKLPAVGQASRLTPAGSQPALATVPPGPRGWLRRWWPALAPAAVSLACAAVVTIQQMQINNLKESIQALKTAPPPGEVSPAIPPTTDSDPAAVDLAANEQAEIARLRDAASQLREQIGQLERVRAEKQKSAAPAIKPPANTLAPEEIEELLKARDRASRVACVNNMKQLGLAAKMWALDHGDKFPEEVLLMTNEMSTPKILWCPGEPARQAATDWAIFTAENNSYEYLAASANDSEPMRVLFRCPIHWNIGLCDGSVQTIGQKNSDCLTERDGKLYLDTEKLRAKNAVAPPNSKP